MSIESEKDLIGLLKIGQLIGNTLQTMAHAAQEGMTTLELDAIGSRILAENGARSAPQITYNFPGTVCISVNDIAAHGIADDRPLQDGDLVKLDLSAELDGYFADSALTIQIGKPTSLGQKLIHAAEAAFHKGAEAARLSQPIFAIGRAVEIETRRHHVAILEELPGHGVGRALHEDPTIPMIYHRDYHQKLTKGLVFTIEPHIAAQKTRIYEDSDGWTLRTRNKSLTAAFEHTVVITQGEPIFVTQVVA